MYEKYNFLCLPNPTICTSNTFELLDGPWPDIKALFYVLSSFPCSIVWRRLLFRPIIYVMSMGHLSHDDHVSQSHFSFSQGLVLRIWGCVLVFSCLSLGFLLCGASPLWHVVIGSLGDDFFVLTDFYFYWKIPCTVYVLWWDYSQMTIVVITIKCGVWYSFQRHQFL